MSKIVFEGHACIDCTMVIANDDWSGIEDPGAHQQAIVLQRLYADGTVVLSCDEGCEGSFSWSACDYCGSTLGGDRHPIAVLA